MFNVIDSLSMPYNTHLYNNNNKFYWKLDKYTLPSQPQIAYELIEAWGAEDILQVQGLSIDGLNNSKDTTIQ